MKTGRMGRLSLTLLVAAMACWLQACSSRRGRTTSGTELARAAEELAQLVARLDGDEEIAVLGIRDAAGIQTMATRVLDEYLVSALLEAGVPLVLAEGGSTPWGNAEVVPASEWENLSSPRVLAGRLQVESPWGYLRLFAIDRESGIVVAAGSRRLAERALLERAAQRSRQREDVPGEGALKVELHLLVLRSEGGLARRIEIEEGSVLQPEDRLQIRFRVNTDCEVYAFLYSSEAEVEEVFAGQFAYRGRMHYGPGEEGWLLLRQSDTAYTLYFIAAPRLGDDREELFENMAELIERRQVDRLTGLEQLDRVLVEFLLRGLEGSPEIAIQRGNEGIRRGERESFILSDGTPIESWPEELGASPVLVRALSFLVQ